MQENSEISSGLRVLDEEGWKNRIFIALCMKDEGIRVCVGMGSYMDRSRFVFWASVFVLLKSPFLLKCIHVHFITHIF